MGKLHRFYLAIAREAGMNNPQLVPGGAHPKIVGSVGTRKLRLPVGGSKPSDKRSVRNTVAFIRRQIRRANAGEA